MSPQEGYRGKAYCSHLTQDHIFDKLARHAVDVIFPEMQSRRRIGMAVQCLANCGHKCPGAQISSIDSFISADVKTVHIIPTSSPTEPDMKAA